MPPFLADDIEIVTGVQLELNGPFVACTHRIPDEPVLDEAFRAGREGYTELFGRRICAFRTSKGRIWTERNKWGS